MYVLQQRVGWPLNMIPFSTVRTAYLTILDLAISMCFDIVINFENLPAYSILLFAAYFCY